MEKQLKSGLKLEYILETPSVQPRVLGFLSTPLSLPFILFLFSALAYLAPVLPLYRQLKELSVLHQVLVEDVCVATGFEG